MLVGVNVEGGLVVTGLLVTPVGTLVGVAIGVLEDGRDVGMIVG